MTNNRPEEDALCRFVNGADRPVDVYVNYHDEAYATVKPEEDQSVFSVDSDADRLYGTYTFEARPKDQPDGEVLASASVAFEAGDSYTAVFHPAGPDDFQLSVYDTDFSPTAASRFEIHHTGFPEQVEWTLAPKSEADPRIPADERSGTLERGEWQQAVDVTENEYRLEILVDGEVVAFRQDLELESELMNVCYVVGDPRPEMGSDEKEGHVRSQRYHVPPGPEREDETTAPAEPHSTTDDNQPVEFDYDLPDLYETNPDEIPLRATDPDGVVTGLQVDRVEPETDGIRLPDDSVDPATGVGEAATATLQVSAELSPGSYDVHLEANPDGVGERTTHTVTLDVEPITADRLWERVEHYRGNDAITREIASDLFVLLRKAGAAPTDASAAFDEILNELLDVFGVDGSAANRPDARTAIERVITLVTEKKGDGVEEAAATDIETEARALLERLESE